MQYREDRYGNKLSVLGYGCMRFTQNAGKIDIKKATAEVKEAFDSGVNYFDTAYIYPGSEAALGEILESLGIRDQINIATKLPHYLLKKPDQLDQYFNEELKRLRTDHVDYYLMHMLTDIKTWERIKGLGIVEWLEGKKASGEIRQVGFSYHGNSDMFMELLEAYDWDFCQVQYNYLDENSQAGATGVKRAHEKGIPVVIMEPLRGGRLSNQLPKEAVELFKAKDPGRTPSSFGLSWLFNQPEVTVVLSGMNSLEQVKDNCKTADETIAGAFTEEDFALYGKVVKAINARMKVGCTGCRYCMPCPKGVDIPGTFAAYNRKGTEGWKQGFKEYYMCTGLRKDYTGPGNCIECGKCELHCPQHLEIRKELKNAKRELEGPLYALARTFAPIIMKY